MQSINRSNASQSVWLLFDGLDSFCLGICTCVNIHCGTKKNHLRCMFVPNCTQLYSARSTHSVYILCTTVMFKNTQQRYTIDGIVNIVVSSCCHFVHWVHRFTVHSMVCFSMSLPNASLYRCFIALHLLASTTWLHCNMSVQTSECQTNWEKIVVIYTCSGVVCMFIFQLLWFFVWFINFDRYACNSLSIESVECCRLSTDQISYVGGRDFSCLLMAPILWLISSQWKVASCEAHMSMWQARD